MDGIRMELSEALALIAEGSDPSTVVDYLFEGGETPGRMEIAATPLRDAREYAVGAFRKHGKSLDQELPNFDKNYMFAQRMARRGWTRRRDMPVVEIHQVRALQRRLREGHIDLAPPYAPPPGDPFPEGLSRKQGRLWLDKGLRDGRVDDDVVNVSRLRTHVGGLKPIQKQIYFDKSIDATAMYGRDRTISFLTKDSESVASEDFFIIDGHHRWLSGLLIDPHLMVRGIRIHLPIKVLLPMAKSYGDALGNRRNL